VIKSKKTKSKKSNKVEQGNKAAQIRVLLAEGLSVEEIAKKLKFAKPYVQQVRWHWKKDAKKTKAKIKAAEKKKVAISSRLEKPERKTLADLLAGSNLFRDEKDMVNSPAHYTVGGIETIDFIEAKDLSYHLGNAVKYISRAPHKGRQIEDLKKARWYLDREISLIGEGNHGQSCG
jgi:DNA-binding CsgD family transcriptional regulator